MSSLVTIAIFLLAGSLYKRWPFLLFVPVFFTVAGCILFLVLGDVSFQQYFEENRPVTFMLGPAIVALGVLMYKQFLSVSENLKPLLVTVLAGSLTSVILVVIFAQLFSFPKELAASLMPLGITTPIAIEVTRPLGGDPAITSVVVIGVGLFGNMMAPFLLRMFGVKWDPALGLAIGQTSHGIGTARAVQISDAAGTFSGLAMSINGVITVFTAPLVWHLFGS